MDGPGRRAVTNAFRLWVNPQPAKAKAKAEAEASPMPFGCG